MSGGSLDYLYRKSVGEAVESDDFDRLLEEIETYDRRNAWIAAATLYGIKQRYAQMQKDWDALSDVVRAVEWNLSCDYGRDQVEEALDKL